MKLTLRQMTMDWSTGHGAKAAAAAVDAGDLSILAEGTPFLGQICIPPVFHHSSALCRVVNIHKGGVVQVVMERLHLLRF